MTIQAFSAIIPDVRVAYCLNLGSHYTFKLVSFIELKKNSALILFF